MNTNPETAELREVVQRTVEMAEQNARDSAYLRGAFDQMNRRFEQVDKGIDDLNQLFNYRFKQTNERIDDPIHSINRCFDRIERRIATQLKWIIGLVTPIYLALIALIVKVFFGS
ncbi:hypothetical protein C6502_16115 [Candidatus Poribacteria bacterium]|nr:MAG: hypothetical protein C6502_16115 [Candidatus Poribacteria bacterium]